MLALKNFFAPVKGSFVGYLNPEELYRSILTALGSGTAIGLIVAIVQAILDHISSIIPNSTVASLATIILTLVLDLLRRQSHGADPAPTVPPTPKAA